MKSVKTVRIGLGVTVIAGLLAYSFVLRSDVVAGTKPVDKHAVSGCAAISGANQPEASNAKRRLVFETESNQLLQQGWNFHSYCCNPEFTDAQGKCSVYLVRN